mgnify:CR=1 FL=1
MKGFNYFAPSSMDECLKLLDSMKGRARILAGGTDLMVRLKHDMVREDNIIDITRLDGMQGIIRERGYVHIAPLATHSEVLDSYICDKLPVLKAACALVGSPQIRNRGTIGGNVMNASPAGDTIPALFVHGAALKLKSADGERLVPIGDFYTGPGKTVMKSNEMLVDISVPEAGGGEKGFFKKLGQRNALAISIVNVAVLLKVNQPGRVIEKASVALGAAGPTVIRCTQAEELMTGSALDGPDMLKEIARSIRESASPISDVRASAGYRAEMSASLFCEGMYELGVI